MFDVDPILLQKYRDSVDLSNFPKGALKWFNQADEKTQDAWFRERYKCLKYPIYLSGYVAVEKADPNPSVEYTPILGMDFQQNPHALLFQQFIQKRPGEGLVLSDLEKHTKKRMVLWPRGTMKTSSVRVDIVQTILNYPNVRICFLTGGDLLAKRQLAAIKKFFEKPSSRFRFLFPEFCTKSVRNKKIKDENDPRAWTDELCSLGTAHEFTVPCRTSEIFAEPTFAISTARSVKAGSHFDIIYIDDLVTEVNFRSIPALEKCYEDYLAICPLLEPTGYIIMSGTRYSFGDTYERIQDAAKEEEKKIGRTIWKFSIRDCWSMGCQNCSHTSVYHDYDINIVQPPCTIAGCTCIGFKANGAKGVLFPETRTVDGRAIGHTLEFLEGEKIRLGEEFFANQYCNLPIALGSQTFDEHLIGSQTFHTLDAMPSYTQGYTFGVGDLAYVGQDGRDYSVIYMCRAFQGRIYVFDCEFGNWDSGQVAEKTVDILLKHRPNVLYYEKVNGWDGFDRLIAGLATTKGLPKVPIQWEKGSQAKNAKQRRIGDVKGWLTSGRLWFYGGMRGYDQMVKQLVKWPKLGRHDDFADCVGQIVAAPTGVQMTAPPQPEAANNWLRKLNAVTIEHEPDTRMAGSYALDDV